MSAIRVVLTTSQLTTEQILKVIQCLGFNCFGFVEKISVFGTSLTTFLYTCI